MLGGAETKPACGVSACLPVALGQQTCAGHGEAVVALRCAHLFGSTPPIEGGLCPPPPLAPNPGPLGPCLLEPGATAQEAPPSCCLVGGSADEALA